jgi:prepilin-type N-terminal cleavage/methylation domain-containing protein
LTVAGSGVFPGRVPRGIKGPEGKWRRPRESPPGYAAGDTEVSCFKEKLMRARIRKAFTLVEILIVVVILGILAAIVVPQFTSATQDAQGGNVQTQLSTLQQALELYKAKNNGYPDIIANGWDDLTQNGYLKSDAKNPVNGAANVVAGTYDPATGKVTGASATDGWEWDAAAGVLGAAFFDEQTQKITPNTP